jgi:hypothetical protein
MADAAKLRQRIYRVFRPRCPYSGFPPGLIVTDISQDRQLSLTPPMAWVAVCAAPFGATMFFYPRLFMSNLRQFALLALAVGVICMVALAVAAVVASPRAPLDWIKRRLGPQLRVIAGITVACTFGMAAFWTLKYHFPSVINFWADPYFAAIDQAMHFGDPWRWTHAITPRSAVQFMVLLYFPGWLSMFFVGLITAAVVQDNTLRTRYLISFTFVYVVLGLIVATLFSSVGPIFYDTFFRSDAPRFRDMLDTLRENEANGLIFNFAGRLYAAYTSTSPDGPDNYFAGISAMPSVHVAVATLNALLFSKLSRWAGALGWAFLAVTMFCSVYFGWHYAVDGYVSLLAVMWFWRLSNRFVES